MTTTELKETIVKIVTANSGGIKFTGLLSSLMEEYSYPASIKISEVEELCRTMEDMRVHVLEYTWLPENRCKLFVYTD